MYSTLAPVSKIAQSSSTLTTHNRHDTRRIPNSNCVKHRYVLLRVSTQEVGPGGWSTNHLLPAITSVSPPSTRHTYTRGGMAECVQCCDVTPVLSPELQKMRKRIWSKYVCIKNMRVRCAGRVSYSNMS